MRLAVLVPCFALTWILMMSGCVSNSITNLTSTVQSRSANNQYRIEYHWDSTQQSLRPTSISPSVIIGFDSYPMRRVIHTSNRWETWVTIPADESQLIYHFKVDYDANGFGKIERSSKLSPEYKLVVR